MLVIKTQKTDYIAILLGIPAITARKRSYLIQFNNCLGLGVAEMVLQSTLTPMRELQC